nr:MAG TPA: hypothetical protein [Inoviridae sp.]
MLFENLISAHQILSFCCSERTSHMSELLYRTSRFRH